MCSRKAECIIRKKGNKGSSQGRERTEYKKTGILGIFGEIVLLESSIIISPKLSWRSLGNYYYYNIGKTKEDGCCRWWPTMEQIHPPLRRPTYPSVVLSENFRGQIPSWHPSFNSQKWKEIPNTKESKSCSEKENFGFVKDLRISTFPIIKHPIKSWKKESSKMIFLLSNFSQFNKTAKTSYFLGFFLFRSLSWYQDGKKGERATHLV